LEANQRDVASAEANGTSAALIDRLRLTPDRIAGMVEGLRELAALPDPVGDVVRGWTNANGVQVRQVRVPFGVVGIIYEARPNVTADAGGICLKSGNAVPTQRLVLSCGVECSNRRGTTGRPGRRWPTSGCHSAGAGSSRGHQRTHGGTWTG
jgi:gamma-glutamyl phosphate reductase